MPLPCLFLIFRLLPARDAADILRRHAICRYRCYAPCALLACDYLLLLFRYVYYWLRDLRRYAFIFIDYAIWLMLAISFCDMLIR